MNRKTRDPLIDPQVAPTSFVYESLDTRAGFVVRVPEDYLGRCALTFAPDPCRSNVFFLVHDKPHLDWSFSGGLCLRMKKLPLQQRDVSVIFGRYDIVVGEPDNDLASAQGARNHHHHLQM